MGMPEPEVIRGSEAKLPLAGELMPSPSVDRRSVGFARLERGWKACVNPTRLAAPACAQPGFSREFQIPVFHRLRFTSESPLRVSPSLGLAACVTIAHVSCARCIERGHEGRDGDVPAFVVSRESSVLVQLLAWRRSGAGHLVGSRSGSHASRSDAEHLPSCHAAGARRPGSSVALAPEKRCRCSLG